MEAMLYRQLYQLMFSVAHPPRRPRELYCDRWIALMYFWSVLHDRPAEWASVEQNWSKCRGVGHSHILVGEVENRTAAE